MRVRVGLLVLAVLVAAGPASAAGQSATLQGLSGVGVLVEVFTAKGKRGAGFDQSVFRYDVESKLRSAGIQVLSREQVAAAPGNPFLWVAINPLHERPETSATYSVDIVLRQRVRIERNGQSAVASTWSIGGAGHGDFSHARGVVQQHLDLFIKDWRSVNPR